MSRVMNVTRVAAALGAAAALLWAAPASAQSTDPNPGAMTLTVNFDVVNAYMFRGIRQNATEIALWPFVDIDLQPYVGDGMLKRVGVHAGVWNSLHTGDTGSGGPARNVRYETDYYAGVGLAFGRGVAVTTSFIAYTSPNGMFTTVKEVSVKVNVDDRSTLGRWALAPYALAAFELDTAVGTGQADGGMNGGTYLEVGVGPGVTAGRLDVVFPVRVGISLDDYYELAREDHPFGFVSIGGVVTVPIAGGLSVRGGVEHQTLGDATRVFNGGKRSTTVGTFGVRFAY